MQTIYANQTASISEPKRNPTALLNQAGGEAIAILNHNKPSGYLVPAETFEQMMELMEDLELSKIALERMYDGEEPIKVNFDDL